MRMDVTHLPVHVVVVTHDIFSQLWIIETVVRVSRGAFIHEEDILCSEDETGGVLDGALYTVEKHSRPLHFIDLATQILYLLHELQWQD